MTINIKHLLRLILLACLGLILSLGSTVLLPVRGQQQSVLALVQAGKQHYDGGQFAVATQKLQQAVQIYAATKDTSRQIQTLSLLSLAQQKLGDLPAAQASINSSLSLITTQPQTNELKQVHAQVLNAQGQLQLAQGNATEALETWQRAAKFYSQAGDIVGVIGSQMNQAQALQALGLYRRAEKLLTEVEQQLQTQPDSLLLTTGLQNLGNVRRQSRDLERSHEILQRSLAVAKRIQSPQAESQALLSLANTELALSRKALEIQDTEQLQKYTQAALVHYQQATARASSPVTKIQAQLNQLSLFLETENYQSIQALVTVIAEHLTQLPASRAAVYAHVNFAHSLMKMGKLVALKRNYKPNYQNIAQILDSAVKQAQSLGDKRAESYALGTLGEMYEIADTMANAKKVTQSALVLAQALNATDIAYQWQWQMGRILHHQKADGEAITYYTQAVNSLKELRTDLIALNPDVQFSFRDRVEPVYRQFVDLLLLSPTPSKDNLIQARQVIEALQLAELDNFFRDACAQPKAVNIDNIDSTAAVIYPIILENRLEVILKLPGSDNLRHYANQNITSSQLDAAVKKIRQSISRRSTSLGEIKQASQQLYDWLIKPFSTELETTVNREQSQIKSLVFVLDGSLRNLPMSTLYDGQTYLIERYAVAVTPGLQLLAPKPLQQQKIIALIAGATNAPSFEKEGLGTIDNVEKELTGIEEQLNQSQKLQEDKFRQENVQTQIKSLPFNVVHLATHGKFSSNPEETFILDWDKRITVKDMDNLLRFNQPQTTQQVELLILSACETATGDKRAALGLAGVAIRAGARSTLASLWQINDASTAEFMIQFYKQLNNPQITKAEALRNVQLAFLKDYSDTDYYHPFHWAAFILVGNWL